MSIEAGDVVMVVRPSLCCGNAAHVGKVFRVLKMEHGVLGECVYCRKRGWGTLAKDEPDSGYELPRLKKLDGLLDAENVPDVRAVGVGPVVPVVA